MKRQLSKNNVLIYLVEKENLYKQIYKRNLKSLVLAHKKNYVNVIRIEKEKIAPLK